MKTSEMVYRYKLIDGSLLALISAKNIKSGFAEGILRIRQISKKGRQRSYLKVSEGFRRVISDAAKINILKQKVQKTKDYMQLNAKRCN